MAELEITAPVGPAPTAAPRVIKQLLVTHNTLIALTEDNVIYILNGLQAIGAGTEGVRAEWKEFIPKLPPAPVGRGHDQF